MFDLRKYLSVGLLVLTPLAARALPASLPSGAPSDAPSPLNISDDTQVPGKTLKRGEYTIRIVDHLADRMIVEVARGGKTESLFLALPSSGLSKPDGGGPIALPSGAKAKGALRGFAFPDGTVAEFVYPKAEAVGLAKANSTKIPAIDPESQGLKGNPALSKQDREMVTLWLLSPTLVAGDAKPGIQAERYQAPTATASASPVPTPQVANALARPQRHVADAAPDPAPQQVASVKAPAKPKARPLMAALPHTAGSTPLMWLMGLVTLACAALMTRRRLAAGC